MSKQMLFRVVLVLTIGALASLSLVGCDSKSTGGEETPAGTTVSITATPTSVETNETSIVEVSVTSDGSGVADQVVHFTVTPSSAGTFSPEYDTTNANGMAASVFTASEEGSAVIQASIGGGATSSNPLGLSIGDSSGGGGTSGSGTINVTTSHSLLTANGRDSSTLTIAVRDDLGQPAADSTLIKIAAGEKFVDVDGNGYWSNGIDSLVFDANGNDQWDPIGIAPSTAWTSGGTGNAEVIYVAGEDAYTVYVKITVDDAGLAGSIDIPIQLSPNAVLNSIYLASDSLSLSVTQTGGIETGTLRATGYDINGNPVPEGMAIVFYIIDGPGGGEQLDTLGYGPDTAYTNSQGVATSTVHSGTVSGTIRARAMAGAVLSNATQVLVAAGPPYDIVIGAENCNVPYWDNIGGENAITAIVSDVYNNPVNDSTVVYFTCDEGVIMSHIERTKEGKGIAYSLWYSGDDEAAADGDVWIWAETAGGTVRDSSMFLNTHVPDELFLTGWQSTLPADGESSFYAWVSAVDLNDNFPIGGTPFKADSWILGVSGGSFEDGCYAAGDRVQVVSKTLKVDRSMPSAVLDDGVGDVDYVTYWHGGGASITAACSLLTDYAYSGTSSVDASASAAPGETVFIAVTIQDRFGNPLGGHQIHIEEAGTPIGADRYTNAYGEAFGFTWTAPGVDGSYTIVVEDLDPRGNGLVLTHKIEVASS